MFLPLSLDDAAAWLERNEVTGVTGRDLLKLGAYGYLQIGLPLSCKAYSPSKYLNNAVSRMDAGNCSLDVKKAHDEAHVELLGVYVLPPRTLFELEAKGKARTGQVYGLNGETFSVCVDVALDELRITSQALEDFVKKIEKDSDAPPAMEATVPASEDTKIIKAAPKPNKLAGIVYWRAVLTSQIKYIDLNGKADVRSAIKHLKNLGDKRLPNEGTIDELFWFDDYTNKQHVTKKTFSNALSDIRKVP